jgi:hypothetical protein
VSIRVGRLESHCRFGSAHRVCGGPREQVRRSRSADSNRCVDSRRPTRIAASILFCRLECLCRFGPVATNRCVDSSQLARFTPTDSSRCVESGRPIQIAVSIHIGQLESMRRFRSAGRPPRFAVTIRAARVDVGRLGSICLVGSHHVVDTGRPWPSHTYSCVDPGRQTRIGESIQVGRLGSLCRFRPGAPTPPQDSPRSP